MNKALSITFTGDICFDRYMDKKWEDKNLLDAEILEFLHSSSHVVANVEGAMIDPKDFKGENTKGIFFHTMNPDSAVFFSTIKADIWNLCNNHSMDADIEGLESTISYAHKNGAVTVGAGRNIEEASSPLYFEEAGGVGLFSVGYQSTCVPAEKDKPGNLSWNDYAVIESTIKQIKKRCRHCVLCVHGGEEFCNLPLPYIRDRYIKYLDMGADIIVAHHPHVVQNYESFGNKKIFYSLGNFVFDTDYQRAQFNTDRSVLLRLNFDENSWDFEALGTKLDRDCGVVRTSAVPEIFTEIGSEDYKKLIPLSAKAKLKSEIKRQPSVSKKDELPKDGDESGWRNFLSNFFAKNYYKNEYMDFAVMIKLADEAENGEYKTVDQKVWKYIENQL